VPSEDSGVVYVNAVECPVLTWDVWRKATQIRLLAREHVKSLVSHVYPYQALNRFTSSIMSNLQIVPLARHSTLPELQHFVSIFKPKRVVPNTVLPRFQGADWACIPVMFRSSMAPGGAERVIEDMRANGYSIWADVHQPMYKGRPLISSDSAGLIPQDDPVDLNGHSFTAASSYIFSSAWENVEGGPADETSEATMLLRQSMNMWGAGREGRKLRVIHQLDALLRTGNMGSKSLVVLDRLLKDGFGGMTKSNDGSQSTDTTVSRTQEEFLGYNMGGDDFEARSSQPTPPSTGTQADNLNMSTSDLGPLPASLLPSIRSAPQANLTVHQDRSEYIPIIDFESLSRSARKIPTSNSSFLNPRSASKVQREPVMGQSSTTSGRVIIPTSALPHASTHPPESDAPEPSSSVDFPYHDPPDAGPRGIEQMQLTVATDTSLNDISLVSSRRPQISNWTTPVQDPTKSLMSSHSPLFSSLTSDPSMPLIGLPHVSNQPSTPSDSGLLLKRRLSEYDTNDDVLVSSHNCKRLRVSPDPILTSPTRLSSPIPAPSRASSSTVRRTTSDFLPASAYRDLSIFASSISSSFSARTLRPTARSADPIHLTSQKRQRSQLRELIAKCYRARRRNTSVSKLQVLESEEQTRMASISVSTPPIPTLPVEDESPGSIDSDLVRRLMKEVQNGDTLQLKCVESR
jgi:hypothetical protein